MHVRLTRPDDGEALAAIYAPSVAGIVSFEEVPPNGEELARRAAALLPHTPWLVAERQGEVAGYAYASPHRQRAAYRWAVDTSVYVHRGHRRVGVARHLMEVLLEVLRRQGFHRAHAGVTLPNPASVGLHERLGFRPVGVYPEVGFTQGAWHDVGWWTLPLRPMGEPPEATRPVTGRLVAEGEAAVRAAARQGRPPTGGRR